MRNKTVGVAALTAGLFVTIVFPLAVAASEGGAGETAIDLLNGKNLSGWHGLQEKHEWRVAKAVAVPETDNKKFDIKAGKGIIVNGDNGHTSNLLSDYEHGDCYLHIEFTVPKDSNSGVYFQGLYEIQVLDSFGKKEVESSDCGGIYARYKDDRSYEGHPPSVNASKAPGRWQSFDAIFRAPRFNEQGGKVENARFVAVIHNGIIVHRDVELTGGTRASLDKPEAPRGPLMLQGDHGPVAYRNIRMIPLELE